MEHWATRQDQKVRIQETRNQKSQALTTGFWFSGFWLLISGSDFAALGPKGRLKVPIIAKLELDGAPS
jgi:hypothetical protein